MKCTPLYLDSYLTRREKFHARMGSISELMSGDRMPLHELASLGRDGSEDRLLEFARDVAHAYDVYGTTSQVIDAAAYMASQDDESLTLDDFVKMVVENKDGDFEEGYIELCSHLAEHEEAPGLLSPVQLDALTALVYCTVSAFACCPHYVGTVHHVRSYLDLHVQHEHSDKRRHLTGQPDEQPMVRAAACDARAVERALGQHAPWADYIAIHHLYEECSADEVDYLSNLAEIKLFLDAYDDEAAHGITAGSFEDSRLDNMGRLLVERIPNASLFREQLGILMEACRQPDGLPVESRELLDALDLVLEQWNVSAYMDDNVFYAALLQLSKVEALLSRCASQRMRHAR